MFLLGIIAFFQNVYLPGYIIRSYTGLVQTDGNGTADRLKNLIYGMGLSLLTNYLLVFYFTLFGIYTPISYYLVILVEAGLILLHLRRNDKAGDLYIRLDFSKYSSRFREFTAANSLTYNLLFFAALGVLSVYIFYFFYFLGTVFMHWDPATAWNRFAVELAANQLPTDTWRYPQMMPTNWSVSYVLMQNSDVQLFAKAFMPLMALGNLGLFMELALRKRRAVYLLGLVFYGAIAAYLYDPSVIVSGYVDTGVSFFAFLAVHVMLSRNHKSETPRSYALTIISAGLFAAAAGITKQAGLFILTLMLIRLFAGLFRHRRTLTVKRAGVLALTLLLMVFFITCTWYIVKEIQIRNGDDRSEIQMVQSVHKPGTLLQRLNRGIDKVIAARPAKLKYVAAFVLFLAFMGLFHRRSWWVALFIALPFTFLWGFFFSYDTRNLATAVPFLAYSAAFGADYLRSLVSPIKKIPLMKIPLVPVAIATLAVLVLLNFTLLKRETIIAHQLQKKTQLGDIELNNKLYEFHRREGIKGKIATGYYYLSVLPGLSQYFHKKPGRVQAAYLKKLDADPEIRYILMPVIQPSEKDVYRYYQERIKSGAYRLLFKQGGYRFIDIRAPQNPEGREN